MTILELREKRAKAWEVAKAFLDSHRNEKGVLSAMPLPSFLSILKSSSSCPPNFSIN